MERWKLYTAAALFVLLTMLKLLFPTQTDRLQTGVRQVLSYDDASARAVETLGRSLTDGSWREGLVAVFRRDGGSAEGETEEIPALSWAGSVSDAPDDADASAAVSAFLSEQAKYGRSIPTNVQIEYAELPFAWESPIKGASSSGFGYRLHPIDHEIRFHYGTDLAANESAEVTAFADAEVSAVGTSSSYGKYVILAHGEDYSTLYAHLSETLVREGEPVERGQVIGLAGQTGKATGPHLHFELRCGETYLDPEYYL